MWIEKKTRQNCRVLFILCIGFGDLFDFDEEDADVKCCDKCCDKGDDGEHLLCVKLDTEERIVVVLDIGDQRADCKSGEEAADTCDGKGNGKGIRSLFFCYIIVTKIDERAIDAAHGDGIADIEDGINKFSVFRNAKGVDEESKCRDQKAKSEHLGKGAFVCIFTKQEREGYTGYGIDNAKDCHKSLGKTKLTDLIGAVIGGGAIGCDIPKDKYNGDAYDVFVFQNGKKIVFLGCFGGVSRFFDGEDHACRMQEHQNENDDGADDEGGSDLADLSIMVYHRAHDKGECHARDQGNHFLFGGEDTSFFIIHKGHEPVDFFRVRDIIEEISKKNDDDKKGCLYVFGSVCEGDDVEGHEEKLVEYAQKQNFLFCVSLAEKHSEKLEYTTERNKGRYDSRECIGDAEFLGNQGKIRSCHEYGNEVFECRLTNIHETTSFVKRSIHNGLQ